MAATGTVTKWCDLCERETEHLAKYARGPGGVYAGTVVRCLECPIGNDPPKIPRMDPPQDV